MEAKKINIRFLSLLWVFIVSTFMVQGQQYARDTLIHIPKDIDTLNIDAISLERLPYSSKFLRYITKKNRVKRSDFKRPEQSVDKYMQYDGKRIRSIRVNVLKPFGCSTCDTLKHTNKWYEKVANTMHYPSRSRYIKRLLTFDEGDIFVPLEISENERLVRELSHINDVEIYVTPVEGSGEFVDIVIVCEDKFSWAVELSTDLHSDMELELYNKNLLGKGHSLLTTFVFEDDKDPRWGYSLGYGITNIARSYIDFSLTYNDNYEGRRLKLNVNKDFVTTYSKWAGGFMAEKAEQAHKVQLNDKIETKEDLDFVSIDSWIGHSVKLESDKYVRKNLIFSLGFYSNFFSKHPEISLDSTLFFIDRTYLISSISLSKRKFYRTNYIYDLGKIEDIPKGYYSCLLLGYEDNNIGRYVYAGLNFNKTWFVRNNSTFEYFATNMGVGSFYNIYSKREVDKSRFERGVVDIGLHAITRLYQMKRSRIRFYNDFQYTIGFLRYPSDYIDLNEDIRGFRSDMARGNQKLSFSLTQNVFLPYVVNGFRFSFFTFADFGMIGSNDDWIFKKETYCGLGCGIKFNNDNLVFKTLSIRLAFYPKPPEDFRNFKFLMRGEKRNDFVNLNPQKPAMLKY